jgi:hypothetical protein
MELIPLSNKNRNKIISSSGASFVEPFLETFEDEYGNERRYASPRHRRRRRRGIPLPLPIPGPTAYQPPTLLDSSDEIVDEVQNLDLFWTSPPPPSPLGRTLALGSNKSPYKDEAGILSYGCCCCQCVRTQEIGITENCGEFQEILEPGFYCFAWPWSDISSRLSLRVQQLDVLCETKTKDDGKYNAFHNILMLILILLLVGG